MGQYLWNINLEKAVTLAHSTIIGILKEIDEPIHLSELVILLNKRTQDIVFHQNKKRNYFSKYLKSNYGGVLKFLDDHNIYGVITNKNTIKVILIDELFKLSDIKYICTNDNEWVFV